MVTYSREVLAADGGAGVLATKVQGAGYGASVVSDKPLSSSAGSESLFLVSFADDAGVGVGVDWDANACFEMIKTAVSSKRGVMSVYRKDAAATAAAVDTAIAAAVFSSTAPSTSTSGDTYTDAQTPSGSTHQHSPPPTPPAWQRGEVLLISVTLSDSDSPGLAGARDVVECCTTLGLTACPAEMGTKGERDAGGEAERWRLLLRFALLLGVPVTLLNLAKSAGFSRALGLDEPAACGGRFVFVFLFVFLFVFRLGPAGSAALLRTSFL